MLRRRRMSSDDVQIISDDTTSDSSMSFVDLTQESPGTSRLEQLFSSGNHEIVDLTCGDNSPVILDPVTEPPPRRRRSRRNQHATTRSSRRHSPYSSNSDITIDSDENDMQVMSPVQVLSPVNVNNALPWPELPNDASATADVNSPARKQVKCPVCMENETQILASNLRLMSTTCGHIFCNRCIRGAIQTQQKCPSCRKKLTKM